LVPATTTPVAPPTAIVLVVLVESSFLLVEGYTYALSWVFRVLDLAGRTTG
jgi:hypothetical protein